MNKEHLISQLKFFKKTPPNIKNIFKKLRRSCCLTLFAVGWNQTGSNFFAI